MLKRSRMKSKSKSILIPTRNEPPQIQIDKPYPMGYNNFMIEIRKTDLFAKWIDDLKDVKARARILVRIERLAVR